MKKKIRCALKCLMFTFLTNHNGLQNIIFGLNFYSTLHFCKGRLIKFRALFGIQNPNAH